MTHEDFVGLLQAANTGIEIMDGAQREMVLHVDTCDQCISVRDAVTDPELGEDVDGTWDIAIALWGTHRPLGCRVDALPLIRNQLKAMVRTEAE